MKKAFKLEDLDCANCAAKMERAINEMPEIKKATVNFMMQKMTVEADDESFDAVMKKAVKLCKRIEPDCTIILK